MLIGKELSEEMMPNQKTQNFRLLHKSDYSKYMYFCASKLHVLSLAHKIGVSY